MKKILAASALAVLTATPAFAGGGVEVRLGAFFPTADNTPCGASPTCSIFADVTELFALRSNAVPTGIPPGVSRGDWDGFYGGAEFSFRASRSLEIGFHVDGYGKTLDTIYREYYREDDRVIPQTTHLKFVPVGFSVRLISSSRRARLLPYVTIGGDMVYYRYEEAGEFVDFSQGDLPIDEGTMYSSGWLPGAHAAVGLRVPLSDDFRFVVEGKYLWTASERMNGDRDLNEIDARGFSVTGGFHLRF